MYSVKKALTLYAVTDRAWLKGRYLDDCVADAVAGGATMIQLREKNLATPDFLVVAEEIKEICQKHQVPFIINDNLFVAMACDADGIHVGQDDLTVEEIKKRWPGDKIIGVSAQTLEQAKTAEKAGASYLGVGAVFPTSTKDDAVDVTLDELSAITEAVDIPVCAIGGIHPENIRQLYGTGIDGVALVSEIFAKDNIRENAEMLSELTAPFKEACRSKK